MTEFKGLMEVSAKELQTRAEAIRDQIEYRLGVKADACIVKARAILDERSWLDRLLRRPARTYTDEQIAEMLDAATKWDHPLFDIYWDMCREADRYDDIEPCLRAAESSEPDAKAYVPLALINLMRRLWLEYTVRVKTSD